MQNLIELLKQLFFALSESVKTQFDEIGTFKGKKFETKSLR